MTEAYLRPAGITAVALHTAQAAHRKEQHLEDLENGVTYPKASPEEARAILNQMCDDIATETAISTHARITEAAQRLGMDAAWISRTYNHSYGVRMENIMRELHHVVLVNLREERQMSTQFITSLGRTPFSAMKPLLEGPYRLAQEVRELRAFAGRTASRVDVLETQVNQLKAANEAVESWKQKVDRLLEEQPKLTQAAIAKAIGKTQKTVSLYLDSRA